MKLKPGVRLLGIRPELTVAMQIANTVLTTAISGYTMTITCCTEGKHTHSSKHYTGCAFDLRTSDFPSGVAHSVTMQLARVLGADFDVILESDHIHIEFDPKEQY